MGESPKPAADNAVSRHERSLVAVPDLADGSDPVAQKFRMQGFADAPDQADGLVVQQFLGLLHEESFSRIAKSLLGYDIDLSGRMIYPKDKLKEE